MEVAPARRHRWATPETARALGIGTLLLLLVSVPLSVASHQFIGNLGLFPLMAPFAIVGFIVARREPRNPIGWIMLGGAATYILSSVAGSYSVIAFRLGHPDLPGARLAAALTQFWIALPMSLPLPVLLFPDGRVSSRFWRVTLRIYVVLCLAFVAGTASKDIAAFTDRTVHVDSSGELVSLSGSSHDSGAWVAAVLFVLFIIISLAWVIRAVVSYRRTVGERRQQLKWLMSGGAIAIVGFTLALMFGASHNHFLRLLSLGFIGITALPVSIGVGILRYRLYEIDRMISRTLSYAIVTGLLIGVYVGLVTLSTRALPLSSPIGVAASTLAAVALFTPLRRRVQRTVDRRFNRSRYDAEITVAAFSASLRDAVDLNRIERELVGVVQRAIEPSHVSIWLRPGV